MLKLTPNLGSKRGCDVDDVAPPEKKLRRSDDLLRVKMKSYFSPFYNEKTSKPAI